MEEVKTYINHKIDMENLLCELGYNTNLKGYTFLEELVYETRLLLTNGKSEDEIRKTMPMIITEYGSCYHEIGIIRYVEEINKFFEKHNPNDKIKENDEINMIIPTLSLEEKVLLFSKYLNKTDNNEKVYKK